MATQEERDFMDLVQLLHLSELGEERPTNPLEGMDRHDIQDLRDGCGRWTGQAVPHERRFWMRQGRFLDSRRFNTMFRCM